MEEKPKKGVMDISDQVIPIGVDFGTSNSCAGVYINGNVKISSNSIGERITPSVVLFTKNNKNTDIVLVGEEVLLNNSDDIKNYIYEIKRFIGLDYEEFEESGFKNSLNYDIVNKDGMPKIKIQLNNEISYYTVQEICTYIIKKIIRRTEDFIGTFSDKKLLSINNAVFTIPTQFTKKQKESIKQAAKDAGIKIPRLISEPTAAALAYGIGDDLVSKEKEKNKMFMSTITGDDYEINPSVSQIKKSEEKVLAFDLGGGTFDLTILKVKKEKELTFEVELTRGDIHLGGSDFDKMLMDYCIDYFCEENQFQKEDIKKNNNSYKKLKFKCENAKRLLGIKNEVFIQIDNFYEDNDLILNIKQNDFEKICMPLYQRIKNLIKKALQEMKYTANDIDKVVLVGGATRIYGIKELLIKIFDEKKIMDNINPEEAVAIGATLYAAKIQIKEKMNFTLQDIIPYNIGIETKKSNQIIIDNESIMSTIIKKYSKIPCNRERKFSIELTDNYPDIIVKIYEGNDDNVKRNNKLGEIVIMDLGKIGTYEYKIKLGVDLSGQLSGSLISEELNINQNIIFQDKINIGFFTGKKLKISENKNLGTINNIVSSIRDQQKIISESQNLDIKLKHLKVCSEICEILIDNYKKFVEYNENISANIFKYTKELFSLYLQIIKMKKEENEIIIKKIKERMSDLIKEPDYIEVLLMVFKDLRLDTEFKNVFYIIFNNYMELLNDKGIEYIKAKKCSRYYSKLYLEKVFFSIKKLIDLKELSGIDIAIKEKFCLEKERNEEELNKINSFAILIEKLANEEELLYGNTGLTKISQKLKGIKENPTPKEIEEILDIYHNMANSFDKAKNSVGEAYCLANIIEIYNRIQGITNYYELEIYIERFESIMKGKNLKKFSWYDKIRTIINSLQKK